MNILLIGSGGREHALAWKLSQSAHTDKLYAVPGNPGIAQFAECISGISVEDNDAIVALAKEKNIGLVVVGPEVPLVNGVVDGGGNQSVRANEGRRRAGRLEGLCEGRHAPL